MSPEASTLLPSSARRPGSKLSITFAVGPHGDGSLLRWQGSFELKDGVPEQAFLAEVRQSL